MYLRDLKPHTLQAWIDALPTPYVAKRARRILHIALGEAEQLGLIAMNPLHRTTALAAPVREGQSWTPEQAQAFLAVARSQRSLSGPSPCAPACAPPSCAPYSGPT